MGARFIRRRGLWGVLLELFAHCDKYAIFYWMFPGLGTDMVKPIFGLWETFSRVNALATHRLLPQAFFLFLRRSVVGW